MAPAWSPETTAAMNSSRRARVGMRNSRKRKIRLQARFGEFVDFRKPGAALCERRQPQHHEAEQDRWVDHEIDGVPAVIRQQLTRRERADRHRAEDEEIVEGLHLVL